MSTSLHRDSQHTRWKAPKQPCLQPPGSGCPMLTCQATPKSTAPQHSQHAHQSPRSYNHVDWHAPGFAIRHRHKLPLIPKSHSRHQARAFGTHRSTNCTADAPSGIKRAPPAAEPKHTRQPYDRPRCLRRPLHSFLCPGHAAFWHASLQ